jgi:hypothetical protein
MQPVPSEHSIIRSGAVCSKRRCEWGGRTHLVGRLCGEGRGIAVEVGDHGAGLVAELEARGGHGGAGLLPELLLERLDDGLRSVLLLATGVRDEIQVGDGVQVVPAGHKDIGVSSDIK